MVASPRYEIVRQFAEDDAVLRQHVVEVVTQDDIGGQVLAAACFQFDSDLINRIEEYSNFVPHRAGSIGEG